MDTYILGSSLQAPLTGGNFQINEIVLDLFTSSKARKVANLKTFWFDKASDRNVQQKTKKLLVTEGSPLSVITENSVTNEVRKDPIYIMSTGVAFMMASEQNLRDLVHKIQEKDVQIKEMEEEVRRRKRDNEILKEFRICIGRVKTKFQRWLLICTQTSKSSSSW
jgi:hypothetical protein